MEVERKNKKAKHKRLVIGERVCAGIINYNGRIVIGFGVLGFGGPFLVVVVQSFKVALPMFTKSTTKVK